MQAIILAGGFGTRLRKVVDGVPKPMAPVGSKPFLAYLLNYLAGYGVTKVVLSVGYLHEQIVDYFGNSYAGMEVEYSIETIPLGTGGAIREALSNIHDGPVLVLNGDTFFNIDYGNMVAKYRISNTGMVMALKTMSDCSRYGKVEIVDGVVVAFHEKQGEVAGLINSGVYLISPDIFSGYDLPQVFSFERDFLYPFTSVIKPVAKIADGYFIDIGVPEDYLRAQEELGKYIQ